MSSFRIRFRSFSASTNDSYMKFVNENWSTQKNRREQRFFLNAYFFCREFCWFFWNDPLASPHTGNTHFYLFRSHGLRARWEVSMPSHGQHSFLLYPLKCPCFMRIIDPIFAGNSQNILKKTFFRGFTCMFTVCSYLKFLFEPFWLYHT